MMAVSKSSHVDGCPSCTARNNFPQTTEPVPNGVQCHYTCRECGQQWATSWWGGDE